MVVHGRARGFSLLEVILACTFLVMILTASFFFFRMGSRGFYTAIAKSGAVGDVQRAARIMQREIELTHLLSATVHKAKTGEEERHGLAVVGLSSWSDPANFEADTGLPCWNRWNVFYASREEIGSLYHIELMRAPHASGSFYPLRLFDDLANVMRDDPLSVPNVLRAGKLCDGVKTFAVEVDDTRQIIKIRLRILSRQGKRMTSNQSVEKILETEYEIVPANTFPEL